MEIWDLKKADSEFSIYIRERDHRCMNPRCPNGLSNWSEDIRWLECSHYWPRGDLIARFDPENCIALCRHCHQAWENTKQGRYREVMIRWLGLSKYKELQKRVEDYKYKNIPHITMSGEIKKCRMFIQKWKSEVLRLT